MRAIVVRLVYRTRPRVPFLARIEKAKAGEDARGTRTPPALHYNLPHMNADMRDLLIRELSEYRPGDLNEREHVWRTLELLHLRGAVASRHHFGPGHLTASAFIVDPEAKKILLHHHRRLDRWLQMGGHLDHGESPREAAVREAREESGLQQLAPTAEEIFDVDVHSIPSGKGEPDHIHYDLRYLFTASVNGELKRSEEESNELRWFDFDEAEKAMNEEASSRVLRKVRKWRAGL